MASSELVELTSGFGFNETLDRLAEAVESRGLLVFARIDHRANAVAVGLDMPPTTVVVFGNAKGGTPLMLKAPALALDLPLRVLVREGADGVVVSYHEPAAMVRSFGLPEADAAPLQGLAKIAQEAAGVSS